MTRTRREMTGRKAAADPCDRVRGPSDQPVGLPPEIEDELKKLPRHVTRRQLAKIITQFLYPISHRSLEPWPLSVRLINGYACISTREGLTFAYRKFAEAPLRIGGGKNTVRAEEAQQGKEAKAAAPD
jgi:hypothetical protein